MLNYSGFYQGFFLLYGIQKVHCDIDAYEKIL